MICRRLKKDATDFEKIEVLARRTAEKEGWPRVYITRCGNGNYDFTPERPDRYVAVLFVEV